MFIWICLNLPGDKTLFFTPLCFSLHSYCLILTAIITYVDGILKFNLFNEKTKRIKKFRCFFMYQPLSEKIAYKYQIVSIIKLIFSSSLFQIFCSSSISNFQFLQFFLRLIEIFPGGCAFRSPNQGAPTVDDGLKSEVTVKKPQEQLSPQRDVSLHAPMGRNEGLDNCDPTPDESWTTR